MSLEVEVCGVEFKNPIIIGSAGYAEDSNGIARFIKKGYGGIVTKSTAGIKLAGAPPPRVFWYDPYRKSYLDGDEAHRNPSIDEVSKSIRECKSLAERENCRLIGSISSCSVDEAIHVGTEFEKAGVSALEIDMQCPAVGDHLGPEYATRGGGYWGDYHFPERSIELIKALKAAVDIPIWPKVATNSLYLVGEKIAKEAKPDGFAFMGYTFPSCPLGLAIDLETERPIFSGNTILKIKKKTKFRPGCGVIPLWPTTVLATAILKNKMGLPLLPSGGFTRGFDIVQAMMAGANAVEICTAVYKDVNVVDSILRELTWFINKKGYSSIQEVVGIALPNIPFDLMDIPNPT